MGSTLKTKFIVKINPYFFFFLGGGFFFLLIGVVINDNFTFSIPEKLKNSIFEIPIILQSLNINT